MTREDPAARTLERLLAVDWSGETAFDHRMSRARLMREYLRRAAWWAQAVDATDEWPFFDIAVHVNPIVRADDELVEQLEKLIAARIGWPAVQQTCRAALHWAELAGRSDVRRPDLADPFEPLLMMYERGGGFVGEHGSVEVGLVSVRLRTWQDNLNPRPVVELHPAVLDALDRT